MSRIDLDPFELGGSPFNLDAEAIAWVAETFAGFDESDKLGQVMLPHAFELPGWRDRVAADSRAGRAGLYRFPNESDAFLLEAATVAQAESTIPPLFPTDIEFDEIGGLGDSGTAFPNQLAIAATDSAEAAARMATVAAEEGADLGYNWSFTPVVDLSYEPRNTLVTTRSFGSKPERVARLTAAYIEAMEGAGVASCAKHFPGDGMDERDQHVTVTVNDLPLDEWWSTFGLVWRAAIAAGARTIMPGHVSLPAYGRSIGLSDAESHLPATLAPALLGRLMRDELGFRGLIVSDASEMGGFGAAGKRSDIVPACIQAGCDILLFPLPGDLEALEQALADGRLTHDRLDEAVVRVLALKASLGLHLGAATPEPSDRSLHAQWAEEAAQGAVTLVRDRWDALPLDPSRPRLGILTTGVRDTRRGDGRLPTLLLPDLLRERGFEVTIIEHGVPIDPTEFDALLYLTAEESRLGRPHRRLPWWNFAKFPLFMRRYFHQLPCILVSFGDPHHLWDAPTWPTLVNAYSPVPAMQRAVVRALCGEIPFAGDSPVDAFAGVSAGELDLDTAVPGFTALPR